MKPLTPIRVLVIDDSAFSRQAITRMLGTSPLVEVVGGKKTDPVGRLQKGLAPLPAATIAAFANGPFRVASIGDDSPLLAVSCGSVDGVDDASLETLAPIAGHVTELDLARTKVGDRACAVIAKMPRLTTLDLRQTQVGNSGVAALAACTELRSLNLFGTKTGDYALAALAAFVRLYSSDLFTMPFWISARTLALALIGALVVLLIAQIPALREVAGEDLAESTKLRE